MKSFLLFIFLLCSTLPTISQPVTGVWRGTITQGSGMFARQTKIELKLIKKGDSLVGTSYIYLNTKGYVRHSVRGNFDSLTNSIHWSDHQYIASKPERKQLEGSSQPMVSHADFSCPDGELMKLDGKTDIGDSEHFELHLTKIGKKAKSIFADEWDNVIDGYFEGMATPSIIDSVWAISSVPPAAKPTKTDDIAKKTPEKESSKETAVTPAVQPDAQPVAAKPNVVAKAEQPNANSITTSISNDSPTQKTEPIITKVEPPAKKEELPPTKIKTDTLSNTNSAPVIAKAEIPVKKEQTTTATTKTDSASNINPPTVVAKSDIPVKKEATTAAKITTDTSQNSRPQPVIAKVETPIKKEEPKATLPKKVDSTSIIVKAQPPAAKQEVPVAKPIAKPETPASKTPAVTQPIAKATVPPTQSAQQQATKPVNTVPVAGTTPPLASGTPTTVSTPKATPIVVQPVVIPQKIDPVAVQKYTTRKKIEQGEIPMVGDTMELHFYDNAEVDGDSISLFVNGKLLFNHVLLTSQAYVFKLPIKDLPNNSELAMVAENLGTIPPNTAFMMAIVDGERYSARLESTESSSGIIKLIRR